MRYAAFVWRIMAGLLYFGIVIRILSAATTKFETLVLAGMVQLYAAVLYNFSLIGVVTDTNNYAGFVRFRILAEAQGITENEDGRFEEQEKAIAERLKKDNTAIVINRISNAAVSLYALFKIVQTVLFT
jgi:hypothetical protein